MYIINIGIGFNDISFGMSSKQIQLKMKKIPRKFRKHVDDTVEIDAYEDFFVYYKETGECEAIEFNRNAHLLFDEIDLFGKPYDEVESIISKLDAKVEVDDTGFTSYKLGIGVYAPFKYENNAVIESIIIFEKGYYN